LGIDEEHSRAISIGMSSPNQIIGGYREEDFAKTRLKFAHKIPTGIISKPRRTSPVPLWIRP